MLAARVGLRSGLGSRRAVELNVTVRKSAPLALVGTLLLSSFATSPTDASEAMRSAAPAFADVTRAQKIAYDPTLTWGAAWVDHDGDGDPDLLANRHWKKIRVYRNVARGYRLQALGFPEPTKRIFDRHTCAWGEADGVEGLDLYCGSGAGSGEGWGPNQLWLQNDGRFRNVSRAYGTRDGFGRSRQNNWIDYDGDDDLDIFVVNKLRLGVPNVMFRNDRGSFTRVDVGLSQEMNGLASTWSDWDGDGDPDLIVTQVRPGPTVAYRNDDGTFTRVDLPGVTGQPWTSASWGDFDGDGWSDLSLVAHDGVTVMRNVRGLFVPAASFPLSVGRSSAWLDVENDGDLDVFVVQGRVGGVNRPDLLVLNHGLTFGLFKGETLAGPRAGEGESVAVADHDRDGRMDAFVTNGANLDVDSDQVRGRWKLYENRSAGGNWIAVDIQGPAWNPLGYGARLRVDASSLSYRRELNDGLTVRAQSEVGHQVLGIGSATSARIRITWPDGTIDCTTAVSNSTVVLRSGSRC